MRTFKLFVCLTLAIVVLFETDLLPVGLLTIGDGSDEFVAVTVMEIVTLAAIPFALRMFHFKLVAEALPFETALYRWGMFRMMLLCLPMVVNTVGYYLYMNVAFGYMAIILFLCLAFITPTKARCEAETGMKIYDDEDEYDDDDDDETLDN